MYFDNIVAHDKGFLFTPSAIKNISDVITLEFNEDIDYSTVVGNVSVSDSNGPVDFNLSQNGTNAVDIQLTDAQLDTVYTITANESISNADGTKSLLNEKSFDVKTAKQENTFAIQSTYPENGSTNVSVVDDVTFEFTNPVDITTLTDENIIVSGDTNYSILLEDENIISIIFDDALDYSTTYNIEFTPGVKDIYNNPLLVGTLTFKTASGINVLFEEDFEGDPEEALARFVDMGRTHDPEYYTVENGALKIVAQTEDGYEQRPKLMIKGSEIWSDYTVKVDAQAASPRAFIGIMARFHDRDNYYETLLYFETAGSNNDRVILRKRKPEYGYAVLDEAERSDYFARYTYYPCELTVKGNEISYYVETKGEPLTGTKTDYAHANGGVAFANTRYTVLYDNIVILDEGFLFTPSRIKNVKDRITLQFNEDVNFSTVDGNITVSDAYGTVDAIISQQGTNGVEIKLVDPQPNTVYTVDVSKNVQSSDGKGMTTDKTFDIKTEIPVVENLSIKTGDQTVNSLTGNMAIYASGDISYFGLQGEQEYTLILAVYDNNGHLYDLSYASETLYAGDTQYTPLTTPTITLPPNVNGYSVKAFVWDDMVNIKPISSSVEVK